LRNIVKAKKSLRKGKLSRNEIEKVRKNASLLIGNLIEYNQRADLISVQKGRLKLKTKDKTYELLVTDKSAFLMDKGTVSRIDIGKGKIVKSSVEEMTSALNQQSKKTEVKIDEKLFEILKKKIGKFEVVL